LLTSEDEAEPAQQLTRQSVLLTNQNYAIAQKIKVGLLPST
jgi:hypothetical protein